MRTAVRPHHVGLTVTDLDRARAWYDRALGLGLQLAFELPGGARGAMLRSADGARVELFEVDGSVDGLAGADSEVWSPRPSPEPGRRMAFVHDLDGNLIELIGMPDR